jgi:hypothetical protein
VAATDENAATGLCVFDRVADQVAQHGTEKQRVLLIVALVGAVRTLTPFVRAATLFA